MYPWKAYNGDLGGKGEGTKSNLPAKHLQNIASLFSPSSPTPSLCLSLLTATSCPRVCGEQLRGIPGLESEVAPWQAGRIQNKHMPGLFQIPAPTALCRATTWGQEGWEHPQIRGTLGTLYGGKEDRQMQNAAEEGNYNPSKRQAKCGCRSVIIHQQPGKGQPPQSAD